MASQRETRASEARATSTLLTRGQRAIWGTGVQAQVRRWFEVVRKGGATRAECNKRLKGRSHGNEISVFVTPRGRLQISADLCQRVFESATVLE